MPIAIARIRIVHTHVFCLANANLHGVLRQEILEVCFGKTVIAAVK